MLSFNDKTIQGTKEYLRKHDWIFSAFSAILFATLSTLAALQLSGTCDELAVHIPSGWLYLTTGVYNGGIGNFPLGQLIIASAAKLLNLPYEIFSESFIFWFRLPIIAIGTLTCIVLYYFAKSFGGVWAGFFSALFFASAPTILAHYSLATLDPLLTSFALFFFYSMNHWIGRPGKNSLLLHAVALGLVLCIKVQGVFLLPVSFFSVWIFRKKLFESRSDVLFSVIFLLGIPLLMLHLMYYGTSSISFPWIIPGEYYDAISDKFTQNSEGHFAYLLGEYSKSGWWYYFPVLIALKTSPVLLVLAALALIKTRAKTIVLFVLFPICLFLAMAMMSNLNFGIRHVLPIYPFLCILAGCGIMTLKNSRTWFRMAVLATCFSVLPAFMLFPDYLSYFNRCAGGARHGHKIAVDSNYDWGQNDLRLLRFLENSTNHYLVNPPSYLPVSGRVLLNANAYYGVLNGGTNAYRWLTAQPVAQHFYTWFEFNLPESSDGNAHKIYQQDMRILQSHTRNIIRNVGSEKSLSTAKAILNCQLFVGSNLEALQDARYYILLHPEDSILFGIAAEAMVHWKLGILRFVDQSYLDLVRPPPPLEDEAQQDLSVVIAAIKRQRLQVPFLSLYKTLADENIMTQSTYKAIYNALVAGKSF